MYICTYLDNATSPGNWPQAADNIKHHKSIEAQHSKAQPGHKTTPNMEKF